MSDAPAPLESRTPRLSRAILIACVVAVVGLVLADVFFMRYKIWWLFNWAQIAIVVVAGIGLIAGVVRLSHALWASSQYVLGELMLTFFAASIVSMGLIEWIKDIPFGDRSERAMQTKIIIITAVTFGLFLSGSAVGLVCFTITLMSALIFFVIEAFPRDFLTMYIVLMSGSLLTLPGLIVERAVKRHIEGARKVTVIGVSNDSTTA